MNEIVTSRDFFSGFRNALYDCDRTALPSQLGDFCSPDCDILLPHPIGRVTGPDSLLESGYAPLLDALPDL